MRRFLLFESVKSAGHVPRNWGSELLSQSLNLKEQYIKNQQKNALKVSTNGTISEVSSAKQPKAWWWILSAIASKTNLLENFYTKKF